MKRFSFLLWAILALVAPGKIAHAQVTYAHPPMLLQVPFLVQVPPGDWDHTKNCGPTVGLMARGYFYGTATTSSAIIDADRWLATRLKDNRYRDPNGYYTNFGNNSLQIFLREYCGLQCGPATGRDVTAILNELQRGRPVIVGVKIFNGKLTTSGGDPHWALAVGWNPKDQKIILNDPGANKGRFIQYPIADFDRIWATQGRVYSAVWK